MAPTSQTEENIFVRRVSLYRLIKRGYIGLEVLSTIFFEGVPASSETGLWDYKVSLPSIPTDHKPTSREKEVYNQGMAEIVKDAVAFYNSYGGYLIIGVNEKRDIVGYDQEFRCDELNKKIFAATRHSVECHYSKLLFVRGAKEYQIAILFVPQRIDDIPPVQFVTPSPTKPNGLTAYSAGDIYMRQRDECRPAKSAEDFAFLFAKGRRTILPLGVEANPSFTENNLPERDPTLVRLVGRDEYLEQLWHWLPDRYTTVKLLSGPGGVGKTTIARSFAEDVIRNAPEGLDKVIWLSAKKKTYAAILGHYVESGRVRFSDLTTLLQAILEELGIPLEEIHESASRDALIEQTIEALRILPALVIVDDLDSLSNPDQYDVFRTFGMVLDRVAATGSGRSRAIFTARLRLGAAPNQLIMVHGLLLNEFAQYVKLTAGSIGIVLDFGADTKPMRRFHSASSGSPLFAASILTLMSLGESLQGAISEWAGSEGEEVRKFAFEKELDSLTDSQIRTLFAASQLGDTSFLELLEVTESPRTVLRDDIGGLREYHLLSMGDVDVQRGGAPIEVPGAIRLLMDLMRSRIPDPTKIEKACARARSTTKDVNSEVARHIHRANAFWRQGLPELALETAEIATRRIKDNPDLICFLGCALIRVDPPRWAEADATFRKAHKLGCKRPELFKQWMEVKRRLFDWIGLIDLSILADAAAPNADNVISIADAYNALGDEARRNGAWVVAADHFRNGAEEIAKAFDENRARGRVADLLDLKSGLCVKYVQAKDIAIDLADQKIEVWLACQDAIRLRVKAGEIIYTGARRLEEWCDAVMRRSHREVPTSRKMSEELSALLALIDDLKSGDFPRDDLVAFLEGTYSRGKLAWQKYQSSIEESA